jgi:hypothetical protein
MALMTWAFMALVLVIAAVLIVIKLTRGATAVPPPPVAQAPSGVVDQLHAIPSAAYDAAGAPGSSTSGAAPTVLSGQAPLTVGGLPGIVFVGAEFSPYSAAMRWALVAALERFGTVSHLGATSSSPAQAFGRTPTFTFAGAGYTSAVVGLEAIEEYGDALSSTAPAGFPALAAPPASVQALLRRYDGGPGGALLPFLDIANRVVFSGAATFSPGLLAGMSMSQVAAAASDPTTPIGRAVLGEANLMSAAICAATGQRPAALCTSAGVRTAATAAGIG